MVWTESMKTNGAMIYLGKFLHHKVQKDMQLRYEK